MDVFPDLFVRVQGWYEKDGGVGSLIADLAPDVVWRDPSGRFAGREQVADHLRRTWSHDDLRPEHLHVLPDGPVVVDVHRTVRDERGTVRAEGDEQHRYRLTGSGLVVEFTLAGTR